MQDSRGVVEYGIPNEFSVDEMDTPAIHSTTCYQVKAEMGQHPHLPHHPHPPPHHQQVSNTNAGEPATFTSEFDNVDEFAPRNSSTSNNNNNSISNGNNTTTPVTVSSSVDAQLIGSIMSGMTVLPPSNEFSYPDSSHSQGHECLENIKVGLHKVTLLYTL